MLSYLYLSAERLFLLCRNIGFHGKSSPPCPYREATGPSGQILKEVPKLRVKITLRCNECKQRNYNTIKNKKNTPDKLEMSKYCRFCRKHTMHSETK